MIKRYLVISIVFVLISLQGCTKPTNTIDTSNSLTYDELLDIVKKETVVFQNNKIPDKVIDILDNNKAIIIGEYHDTSKHEDFVADLALRLNSRNLKHILIEFPQGLSLRIEDYVLENSDELAKGIKEIYGVLLSRIRDINKLLPEEDKIIVTPVDVNNNPQIFINEINLFKEKYPKVNIIDKFLTSITSEEKLKKALTKMEKKLADNSSEYISLWGEKPYQDLVDLIYGEVHSIDIRKYKDNYEKYFKSREELIKKLVDRQLSRIEGGALINIGYYHGQKNHYYGTKHEWLGEYLSKESPYAKGKSYSLVVVPAKGNMKFGNKVKNFDITNSSPSNELFRLMNEISRDDISFISLDNKVFSNSDIIVNYHHNLLCYSPKDQFDGFILLPEVKYSRGITEPKTK